MSIHGVIQYKAVDHDAPVQLNSRVSLSEAVQVWTESLSKASIEAGKVRGKWYPVEGNVFLEVTSVRLVQWFDRL